MSYGEGSIFKRKNKNTGKIEWFVEVQVGLKANGKPRTTRRRAKDQKDAIRIRRELNNQKAEGGLDSQDNVTLADFGRSWIRNHKSLTLKPSVATDYESRLRNHVFPYLGKIKVRELTFKKANWWMNQMLNDGYSVSTINGARRVFSMVCKHAQRLELLKSNPVALTDPLKRQIGDKTQVCPAWTIEEAQQALAVAENTEFDLFVNIGVRLGLRHGEILGLPWSAVDLDANEIKTFENKTRVESVSAGRTENVFVFVGAPAASAIPQPFGDQTRSNAFLDPTLIPPGDPVPRFEYQGKVFVKTGPLLPKLL
jgi:hypothetical protein